jgi:hypothetical protein
MRVSSRSTPSIVLSLVAITVVIGGYLVIGAMRGNVTASHSAGSSTSPMHIDCAKGLCTEVYNPEAVFGPEHYVGHDEPSNLFYSNKPGSGNNVQWHLTLPKDPKPGPNGVPKPGQIFNFQLHGAFWFGMAMCDTQSYPEQLSTCTPNSDGNIVDPALSPLHPGTAFTELQFYPPGWVTWPAFAVAIGAGSCDPTKWCVALNIFSLSQNPVTGQLNNPTCRGAAGDEYVNFGFLTKNGVAHAPASPLLSTLTTFTPDPTKDLFMNSGDKLVVTFHDSPNGLVTAVKDQTTGAHGSMVASAANGFGQVQFDPTNSISPGCTNIPYNFHPMYSTSSEKTRVPWAAHSYNIGFSDEIGHWDYCNGATPVLNVFAGAPCPSGNTEGITNDTEPLDGDELTCFPSTRSSRIQVSGCTDQNNGFDGVPYQPVWPDGTALHPGAIQFSSPKTGPGYSVKYSRTAFEADLPRIEFNTCNRASGVGCTLIPTTDDGQPAAFYPFFDITGTGSRKSPLTASSWNSCVWQLGNHIPNSANDFGQNAQYGTLLQLSYTGLGGSPFTRDNDFRQILSKNPC